MAKTFFGALVYSADFYVTHLLSLKVKLVASCRPVFECGCFVINMVTLNAETGSSLSTPETGSSLSTPATE